MKAAKPDQVRHVPCLGCCEGFFLTLLINSVVSSQPCACQNNIEQKIYQVWPLKLSTEPLWVPAPKVTKFKNPKPVCGAYPHLRREMMSWQVHSPLPLPAPLDMKAITTEEKRESHTEGLWAEHHRFMASATAYRDPGMRMDTCPLPLSGHPPPGSGQPLNMTKSSQTEGKYRL